MNATQILLTLDTRGAVVQLNGDKLRVVPSAALDDELRASIRAHKAELLAIVSRNIASKSGSKQAESTSDNGGISATIKTGRLTWSDVPHSSFDVSPHQPTDPAKVLHAHQCAEILTVFGNAAIMTKSGAWLIHKTRYSHEQAVTLAATVTARRNGQPVTPPAGAKYFDAGAAYRDFQLLTSIGTVAIQGEEIPPTLAELSEAQR